jgi:hypothetical protein
MRPALLLALTALVLSTSPASPAQEKGSRYGVALDTKTYPQATPKEALGSVLKAASNKKFDYLVAQLADPDFIDGRVKRLYGGKFQDQVEDTRARLDPATLKLLQRFLDKGKWTTETSKASVRLADVKDRVVRLVQKDGRWYLVHRFAVPAPADR